MRVLVVGPGYVGSEVVRRLAEAGVEVRGLRRSEAPVPGDPSPLVADVTRPLELPAETFDAVVYAVAPGGRSEAAYRAAYVDGPAHVMDWLGWAPHQGRFLLVGSTGVYGQADGEWVDEDTPPEPASPTARVLAEAEASLHARRPDAVVLRLGGIYGPGRTRTIEMVRDGSIGCPSPGIFGNRIHRDDAAAAVIHLLELADPAPIYLGVDRDPADLRDVYAWLADRLGVPDPCATGEAGHRDAPERRGTNKRCDGSRLVDSGFSFAFSTFREGYGSLIEA
jgi:nucleoside-diphosphate-sugar epimerase